MRRSTALMGQWSADRRTGESLHFKNCMGGYFSTNPEYGLKLVGKTEQKTLSGKNLFDIDNASPVPKAAWEMGQYEPRIENGVIWNGGIHNYSSGYVMYVRVKSAGAHTIQFDALGVAGHIVLYEFSSFDQTGFPSDLTTITAKYGIAPSTHRSVTVDVTKQYMAFATYTDEQHTFGITNIQIESGDTATLYEPYCGGRPSPNSDFPQPIQCVKAGTVIECLGRNFCNIGSIGFVRNKELPIGAALPAGTYTFSAKVESADTDSDLCYVAIYDKYLGKILASWQCTRGERFSKTFTIAERATYIYFYASNGYVNGTDDTATFSDIMITPSGSTEYEPYVGSRITLPCDLYEGDVYYPMSGIAEHYAEVLSMDTLTLARAGGASYVFACSMPIRTVVCTHIPLGDGMANTFQFDQNSVFVNLEGLIEADSSGMIEPWQVEEWQANGNANGVLWVLFHQTPTVRQYASQPIFAPRGEVNVIQTEEQLCADMSATMPVLGSVKGFAAVELNEQSDSEQLSESALTQESALVHGSDRIEQENGGDVIEQ